MEQSILFICLVEENYRRSIFEFSKELFLMSDYEIVYENISGDIVGFSNGYKILIVFDYIQNEIDEINFDKFSFDIVIHTFIKNNKTSYINHLLQLSNICILNSDDENLISLVEKLDNVIAITYGFNTKSTLTISSHNINQIIGVNLCLQRAINPVWGAKLEPFEFSMEISSEDEGQIYPLLAAATLNLVIGESILTRKKILLKSS